MDVTCIFEMITNTIGTIKYRVGNNSYAIGAPFMEIIFVYN